MHFKDSGLAQVIGKRVNLYKALRFIISNLPLNCKKQKLHRYSQTSEIAIVSCRVIDFNIIADFNQDMARIFDNVIGGIELKGIAETLSPFYLMLKC